MNLDDSLWRRNYGILFWESLESRQLKYVMFMRRQRNIFSQLVARDLVVARRSFKNMRLPVRRVVALFLFMGLLMGCETTGHISSTVSEDEASANIIPPAVVEEEVLEPVVEEFETAPFTSEPLAPAIESTEDLSQEVRQDSVLAEQPEQEMKKPVTPAPASPKTQPSVPRAHVPAVEPSQAKVAEPIQPIKLQNIYFDFDQAAIRASEKPVLETNGALLKGQFKHLHVLIEGHCDERGTVEYNLVLGMRRAQVVKAYFIDLGISNSRIRIVSYGKERPVCTQQHETCWQKNRRAHFVLQ